MILVDDRDGSSELAPMLSSPNVVCRLDYADFAWSGSGPEGSVSIGVERKSIMDLLNSMTSGRLSGHQLVGLTNEFDWVYLLVEGVWRPDRHSGILQRIKRSGKWGMASQGSRRFMARDVYNYINTLQVMCGVITVKTSSQWESVRWLDSMYGWWQRPWSKHKSHLQFQKPTTHAQLSKPSLVTRMTSQLEGVGWEKARELGKRYGTVEALMKATMSDIMEVKGIGSKLSCSIWTQLHQEGK